MMRVWRLTFTREDFSYAVFNVSVFDVNLGAGENTVRDIPLNNCAFEQMRLYILLWLPKDLYVYL